MFITYLVFVELRNFAIQKLKEGKSKNSGFNEDLGQKFTMVCY